MRAVAQEILALKGNSLENDGGPQQTESRNRSDAASEWRGTDRILARIAPWVRISATADFRVNY
jgi:hypothetical protein